MSSARSGRRPAERRKRTEAQNEQICGRQAGAGVPRTTGRLQRWRELEAQARDRVSREIAAPRRTAKAVRTDVSAQAARHDRKQPFGRHAPEERIPLVSTRGTRRIPAHPAGRGSAADVRSCRPGIPAGTRPPNRGNERSCSRTHRQPQRLRVTAQPCAST